MSTLPSIPGYTLERELGRGGMGVVYLARDSGARQVAIKTIPTASNSDLLARFDREAQVQSALSHPDIVSFHAAGRTAECLWIAMEYLDGVELTHAQGDFDFSIEDRVSVLIRVALAVDFAHAHGVIHRDLKPSNIFITKDGGVRLLDFGVARLADSTLTRSQQALGTPRYMAPEQMMETQFDARVDVFSLGVIAYELFTGQHPWGGENRSAATFHLAMVAKPPSSLIDLWPPRWKLAPPRVATLARIVHGALEIVPERRTASARAFAESLEVFLLGGQSNATMEIEAPQADFSQMAARRVDWAKARAARLLIEGHHRPQEPPPPPPATESGTRWWLALVVLFAAGLAATIFYGAFAS